MQTGNKKKFLATLSPWVYDEVLETYPNKSLFVEEAILKLHMERSNPSATKPSTEKEIIVDLLSRCKEKFEVDSDEKLSVFRMKNGEKIPKGQEPQYIYHSEHPSIIYSKIKGSSKYTLISPNIEMLDEKTKRTIKKSREKLLGNDPVIQQPSLFNSSESFHDLVNNSFIHSHKSQDMYA